MTDFSLEPPRCVQGSRWPATADRCNGVNHGCRCILDADHEGPHTATWGVYLRWEGSTFPLEQVQEQQSAELFWQAWGRRLLVSPETMRATLCELADKCDLPPTWLLLVLMSSMLRPEHRTPRVTCTTAAVPADR